MGLEINIGAVINRALLLLCLCPQGQRSIRVESQCCLAVIRTAEIYLMVESQRLQRAF